MVNNNLGRNIEEALLHQRLPHRREWRKASLMICSGPKLAVILSPATAATIATVAIVALVIAHHPL
jgi:hypothetical protein